MVVEVGGVQLEETHLAAAAAAALVLLFTLFGGKPAPTGDKKQPTSSGKKKPESGKKKASAQPKKEVKKEAPKKDEKKQAPPEAKKEEKKETPKVAPAAEPEVKGKKGKKAAAAAAKSAEEQVKKDEADGWVVAETAKSKKQKTKSQELLANQERNVGQTVAVGAAPTSPKQEKKAAPKSTIRPLGFDFAADAAETARKTDLLIAQQESDLHSKKKIDIVTEELPNVKIPLPQNRIGVIVGPGGANITLLKEKTLVTRIDTGGGFCTIVGLEKEQVDECAKAVKDLIEKGYSELQYEDFSEQHISAVPSSFAELIGPKGSIVKCIKENLAVEIQFPPTEPKGVGKGQPEKKLKIAIAGSKANVAEAKSVMAEILAVHHSELTHPGEIHEEVMVKPQHYAFIIGSRGSELKHIQSNFKVRVFIPRGEDEEAPVLVVGQETNVERAIKYIEKVTEGAELRPSGGGRGSNGEEDYDGGYDDDEYEPWMAGYMYKRK